MAFKAYRRHCELNVEAPPTRKRDLRDVEVDDLWIEAQDSSEAATLLSINQPLQHHEGLFFELEVLQRYAHNDDDKP